MNWTAPFAKMLPVAGLHRIEHEALAVRTSHLKRGLCQPLRTCRGSRVSKALPHEIDQASYPRGIAIVEGLMDDSEGVNSGEGLHDLSTIKDALSFDGGNQFDEHCGDRDGQGVCLYFCNCFGEFAAANRLAFLAINHTDRPLGVCAKGMSGGDRRGNAGHRCEAYRTCDLSETENHRLHLVARIARAATRFEDSLTGAAFGVALLFGLLIAALSVGGW